MEGGFLQSTVDRAFDLGERLVTAVEKLNDTAALEIEAGPAVCPACKTLNPKVQVHEREAQGEMGDFLIAFDCLECGAPFIARPEGWAVFNNEEELKAEVERAENGRTNYS